MAYARAGVLAGSEAGRHTPLMSLKTMRSKLLEPLLSALMSMLREIQPLSSLPWMVMASDWTWLARRTSLAAAVVVGALGVAARAVRVSGGPQACARHACMHARLQRTRGPHMASQIMHS